MTAIFKIIFLKKFYSFENTPRYHITPIKLQFSYLIRYRDKTAGKKLLRLSNNLKRSWTRVLCWVEISVPTVGTFGQE